MIKAVVKGKKRGRDLLIIGLSFGNLEHFRKEPGDTFITINGAELGIDTDVLLFSGETEQDCADTLQHMIGPETVVHVVNNKGSA